MKIYIIVCQHGDEPFGLKVIGNLNVTQNKNIRIKVAHPQALAKKKRYIESDLNRSFGRNLETIESRLANLIEQDIKDYSPDIILDIHTSICKMQDTGIAASDTPLLRNLTAALDLTALVIMPPEITKHSLIGRFADKAISLEFGKYHRSNKLAAVVAAQIEGLSAGLPRSTSNLDTFRVNGTIPKNYANLDSIVNLHENKELGGYPFLAGPVAYSDIGGFLASKDA